ncbi:MAG: hypothetical protein EP336_18005 [Rhodobacteraceae bacterium]|nr:MAG: hypothetical protein EP336_18005 [Paracoccaceae bacterium]
MRRPYLKLNLDERRILATMLQAKATKTKIAETLGRDRSTIHRDIKRNWWHDDEVPQAAGSNGSVSRSQRQNLQQPAYVEARWLTLPALPLRGIPGWGSMP